MSAGNVKTVDPTAAYADRQQRLHAILDGLDLSESYPLLAEATIPASPFAELENSVRFYIYHSLASWYRDETIELAPDLLVRYRERILKLPNITPNGLLLPKRETYLGYNIVHRAVARILEGFGLDQRMESIHLPINVRIVDGKPNVAVDSRPRAALKLHSDVWAGEPSHAIILFFPVLGEVAEAGVEFFGPPVEFLERFRRPLADFSEGAHLLEQSIPYPCTMKTGKAYFTDSYTLHRTLKRKEGLRVSIDFRFLARERVASDMEIPTERMDNYIPFSEWCRFGRDRLLVSDAAQDEFQRTGAPGSVVNAYAAAFRTVDL